MFKKKVYLAEEIRWDSKTKRTTTVKVYGVFKKRKSADMALTSRGFCFGSCLNVTDDLGVKRLLLARRHWGNNDCLARVSEYEVK